MKILNLKKYRSMEQTLNYLPEELEKIRVWCSGCNNHILPPWLEKRPPLERVGAADGGKWIPSGGDFNCPSCQMKLHLPIPMAKQTGGYSFFGDEAYRNTEGLRLTSYSLIGVRTFNLENLENKVKQLKQQLEPDRNPTDWKIHMKDLWSGDVRKVHPIFCTWDQGKVQELCNGLFDLISGYGPNLMVVNASSIFYQPEDRSTLKRLTNHVRDQVYLALVYWVIDTATRCGVRPIFMFDGDVKRPDGTFAQPWATDVFNGGKLNLVYPFLARGMLIEEPEVVPPGSRLGLELADFTSFVIARFLYKKLQGESVDLDPRRLGIAHYTSFASNGDMLFRKKDRYPWGEFFGNA